MTLTNNDLQPFRSWLHGTEANSPQTCSPEKRAALEVMSRKNQTGWCGRRMANHPLSFLVCNVATSPFALILQWQKKKGENTAVVLEWVFLPLQPRHRILSRPEAVAALVRKGRDRIVEIDGTEPAVISIPVRGDDYEWLLRHSTAIQEALMGYTGVVHNNRPKGPLWKMLETLPVDCETVMLKKTS